MRFEEICMGDGQKEGLREYAAMTLEHVQGHSGGMHTVIKKKKKNRKGA